MEARGKQRQLGELVELCRASAREAETSLHQAFARVENASAECDRSIAARDLAEDYWHRALEDRGRSPAVVGLSAAWLLRRERMLAETNHDLVIASNQADQAREDYSAATARETSIGKIAADFRRQYGRLRAARNDAIQIDQLLHRYRP